jgi:signal transduction histidine kinase/ActR/RegA family two-component response regulator
MEWWILNSLKILRWRLPKMRSGKMLEKIQLYRAAIPVVVALSTLLLTTIAAYYLNLTARNNDTLRFKTAVQQTHNTLQDHLETYITLLYAGKGLLATRSSISKQEFHAFAKELKLRHQYPGIQGIGFSQRATAAQKKTLLTQMQQQGQPLTIRPSHPRSEYHVIVYLEPLDQRNRAAIGYDMFTESVRRAAMEQARDTGVPALSRRVTLVQEIYHKKQAGFLIYVPIYQNGATPATVAERRARLRGFIYSPFRADDFIYGILGDRENSLVDLQIYDGTKIRTESLLHHSAQYRNQPEDALHPKLTTTKALQFAGHSWSILYTARPILAQTSEQRFLPFLVILGGLISLTLYFLTRSQVQARLAAEQAVRNLRQSEQALRVANLSEQSARTQAEAANQLKDEFLAVLSHELRTPLSPILGWAKLLQVGNFDQARTQKALAAIEHNAKLQAQLVEDLLDISKILQKKLTLDAKPVELNDVITTALETMQPIAEDKSIQIQTVLEKDIDKIYGDANRLQQIVQNLLSNAIKFTPEGGIVSISLKKQIVNHPFTPVKLAATPQTYAQITVTDSGKGVTPEFLPHLFESFRQEDSKTTRQFGGLGLGLSIARQLTELHGGTIQAESPGEGQGATFRVLLPLLQPLHYSIVSSKQESLDEQALAGLSILVVDDEVDTRELVLVTLQTYGAQVKTAASAAEGLTLLPQFQPHVLVSDIAMPEMDGYQLIQKIRQFPPEKGGNIQAIALTAHAGEINQQQAFKAGFQGYLAKPLDPKALVSAIILMLKSDCEEH